MIKNFRKLPFVVLLIGIGMIPLASMPQAWSMPGPSVALLSTSVLELSINTYTITGDGDFNLPQHGGIWAVQTEAGLNLPSPALAILPCSSSGSFGTSFIGVPAAQGTVWELRVLNGPHAGETAEYQLPAAGDSIAVTLGNGGGDAGIVLMNGATLKHLVSDSLSVTDYGWVAIQDNDNDILTPVDQANPTAPPPTLRWAFGTCGVDDPGDSTHANLGFSRQDAFAVVAPTQHPGTIGFWKNHPDEAAQHLPILIGDLTVTTSNYADVLSGKAKNAHNMLAAQLLATKLSVWFGASTCPVVDTAINDAQTELDAANYTGPDTTTAPKKNAKAVVNAIKNILENYNNFGC